MTGGSDEQLTANRREVKYLLSPRKTSQFVRTLNRELSVHRYVGEGGNRLPRARHYTTTVYFDTRDQQLYRAARDSETNVKLRAREYYDLHQELTELARSPMELVRYTPVLWLELKRKAGEVTTKRRVGIPKREVPTFFERGEISDDMRHIQEQAHGAEAEQVLAELEEFRRSFATPLMASCLVHYRRNAWQDAAGSLRVTLDRHLACYAPPSDLWSRQHALIGQTLGEPRYREHDHIVELKYTSELPEAMIALLAELGAERVRYSKFLTASAGGRSLS